MWINEQKELKIRNTNGKHFKFAIFKIFTKLILHIQCSAGILQRAKMGANNIKMFLVCNINYH